MKYKIVWKIYLIFVIIYLLLAYNEIFKGDQSIYDILDVPISTISVIGLFLYSFNIYGRFPIFWRFWFFLYITWDLSYNLILDSNFHQNIDLGLFLFFIISLLFFIPEYIALYLLSKKHKTVK